MRCSLGAAICAVVVALFANTARNTVGAQAADTAAGTDLYYFGLLTRGPAWTPEQTDATRKIQEGHMANINRMAELGALKAAGPIDGDQRLRGIFIFKVKTADEARTLAASDPAIQAGRLALDLHPWIGPAGIGERFANEKKTDPAFKVKMRTYQLALLSLAPGASKAGPDEERAHDEYVATFKTRGKVAASGPTRDGGALREVLILAVDAAEAARMVASDPMVRSGKVRAELLTWWCAEHVLPDAAAHPR